jgi:hypothetical protein
MSTSMSLEERLAAMEVAITEIQEQLADSQSHNWLQQVTGSFQDEPAFEEILSYGRAIRQADRFNTEEQAES